MKKNDRREVWTKRVERWQDSGLTAKEFAAETGVNPWTLSHWKWKLGAEKRNTQPSKQRSAKPAPKLIEIPPAAVVQAMKPTKPSKEISLATQEPLEVVLRNGLRIKVTSVFDAAALERLVSVLEGC